MKHIIALTTLVSTWRKCSLIASVPILLAASSPAFAGSYSWNVANGNWSGATNWSPNAASGGPGSTDTANVTTGGNDTVSYDTAATGTIGTLNLSQTGTYLTTLALQQNLTVTGGGSISSTSTTGGASLNIGNYIFSIGTGATFTLGSTTASNIAENTSNTSQEWMNTTGTGYVDVNGTLLVANDDAASLLPVINVPVKLETGSTLDIYDTANATGQSNRLTIAGNFTTDPTGSVTIESTTASGSNKGVLYLTGQAINIGTGTTFEGFGNDAVAFASNSLRNSETQTVNLGTTIPNGFNIRDFNAGTAAAPVTYAVDLASSASDGTHANAIDEIQLQQQSSYSTIDVVLGSNLNLATGQSAPFNYTFSQTGTGADATIDLNGHAYDETTATTAAFAPSGMGAGYNQFTIANSGTSSVSGGNGIFRAGSFNLSGGDVAIGAGVILQATTSNQVNNLGVMSGGVTSIDPGSTFYYTGTGTAASLTSNRTIGALLVGNGLSASALQLTSTLTAAGNVTVNAGATLNLNAHSLTLTGGANLMGVGSVTNSGSAATLTLGGTGGVLPGGSGVVGTLSLGSGVTLAMGASSSSIFDVDGTSAYDQIAGGTVGNGGSLKLNFADGFSPVVGDTFDLLSGTSDSGTFSSITSDISGMAGTFNDATGIYSVTSVAGSGATYYVDSTNGSDSNSGTSPASAWKSLSKPNSQTFHPGDQILFICGGVWGGPGAGVQLVCKSSGTSGNPIYYGSYGNGAKPVINAAGKYGSAIFVTGSAHDVTVEGFSVTNYDGTPTNGNPGIYYGAEGSFSGIQAGQWNDGEMDDISILNNEIYYVEGFSNAPGGPSPRGTTLNSNNYNEYGCAALYVHGNAMNNLTISGNYIHDCTGIGLYIQPNAPSSTSYVITNPLIDDNVVSNVGCDGIEIGNAANPLVQYNSCIGAGNNLNTSSSWPAINDRGQYYMGEYANSAAGMWAFNSSSVVFQYNYCQGTFVILWDGQAWDFDNNLTGTCIYEYNYSRGNEGGFMLSTCANAAQATSQNLTMIARFNISVDDGGKQATGETGASTGESFFNKYVTQYYNNIFYRTDGQGFMMPDTDNNPLGGTFDNNIFYTTCAVSANNTYQTSTALFNNNCYYGHTPVSPGSNAVLTNPLFENESAAAAGTAWEAEGGFQLKPNSPCAGTGVVVSGNGGLDYWGNLLSASANIGAFTSFIVVDDLDVVQPNDPDYPAGVITTGSWTSSTSLPGYYGSDYLQDGDTGQGTKTVQFTPDLPSAGTYQVYAWWPAAGGNATNVPINIIYAGGSTTVKVNQQLTGAQWVSLGSFSFNAGTGGKVVIGNAQANGTVAADAIEFVPQ